MLVSLFIYLMNNFIQYEPPDDEEDEMELSDEENDYETNWAVCCPPYS